MCIFKSGDVVQMKSGGPEMVVLDLHVDLNSIHCEWFVMGKKEVGLFDPTKLVLIYRREEALIEASHMSQ